MRVWVTRAQPEAEATAAQVRALGWEPLVAPLLKLRPVSAELDLDGVGALAFTSRNGVRFFAERTSRRDLPAYAVGAATAAALREAGFGEAWSAEGDVETLAGLILAQRPNGVVLHICPGEPAGDLVGRLQAGRASARRAVLYEAERTPLPPEARIAWPGLRAVLIHSPKAAAALVEAALPEPGPAILCISNKAAALLSGRYRDVRSASEPTGAAVLALLGKAVGAG